MGGRHVKRSGDQLAKLPSMLMKQPRGAEENCTDCCYLQHETEMFSDEILESPRS